VSGRLGVTIMSLRSSLRWLTLAFVAGLLAPLAQAHVGTSSVFVQGKAGPYPVYVTVTPPAVIPGEAMVSVISEGANVRSVTVQANVLAGDLARSMPHGQRLDAGPAGSHEFHGMAWIMTQGSWQIRLTVDGDAGSGTLSVPLPASPMRLMKMSKPFGALLIVLGLFLILGLASLASAALREAQQDPGVEPGPSQKRVGQRAAWVAVVLVIVVLFAGNRLWKQEIARYSGNIYRPLLMTTTLSPDNVLHLEVHPPAGVELFTTRRMDDLVLDHNHLMHLYVVRWPTMDVAYHLHPEQMAAGSFDLKLPTMPAGDYRLFADVVHADGFPETAVAETKLNVPHGRALVGDDAMGILPAFSTGPVRTSPSFVLPDGYQYRLSVTPAGSMKPQSAPMLIRANQPVLLSFTLLDPQGGVPTEMQNYMGMIGHAAIIKSDGSVFAHIHPDGSMAMAAYMMANQSAMGSMNMSDAEKSLPNTATFPFGFPSAGKYRVIVQMKHADTVETGAVDVVVQ
jgi:hypothetical protein